ncbi:hypothetical protein DD793_03055 [Helicobacter pylori]|nr:hypothetical protein DD793_03055 [Helicobacter pylori]
MGWLSFFLISLLFFYRYKWL